MTSFTVPKSVLKGAAGLSALIGILAIGSLLANDEKLTEKPNDKPGPKRTPRRNPIVLAPGCGLIAGKELHMVQRALKLAEGPVDVIIHVWGGVIAAVDPIVHALVAYPGRVTVHVPYMAYSGGTMVALAADTIVMGEYAILGPVDPQIAGFAASDLERLMSAKSPDRIRDEFHLLASIGRKADNETRGLVRELVKSEAAVDALTSGTTTHGAGITPERARELGLPVKTGVPAAYSELIDKRLRRPQILWDM